MVSCFKQRRQKADATACLLCDDNKAIHLRYGIFKGFPRFESDHVGGLDLDFGAGGGIDALPGFSVNF